MSEKHEKKDLVSELREKYESTGNETGKTWPTPDEMEKILENELPSDLGFTDEYYEGGTSHPADQGEILWRTGWCHYPGESLKTGKRYFIYRRKTEEAE